MSRQKEHTHTHILAIHRQLARASARDVVHKVQRQQPALRVGTADDLAGVLPGDQRRHAPVETGQLELRMVKASGEVVLYCVAYRMHKECGTICVFLKKTHTHTHTNTTYRDPHLRVNTRVVQRQLIALTNDASAQHLITAARNRCLSGSAHEQIRWREK